MHFDELQLARSALAGDEAARSAIYDRCAGTVYDFCDSVLRDGPRAEEATRAAFQAAFTGAVPPDQHPTLRAWLLTSARREALARGDGHGPARPTNDLDVRSVAEGPDAAIDAPDLQRLVWTAAAGLPDDLRATLDLHLRQGLAGEEMGAVLGTDATAAADAAAAARDEADNALGAFLVARLARQDCPGLEPLLRRWDGAFTPGWRAFIERHLDTCDVCRERRRVMVSPIALLRSAPPIPLPQALRSSVLAGAGVATSVTAPAVDRPEPPPGVTPAPEPAPAAPLAPAPDADATLAPEPSAPASDTARFPRRALVAGAAAFAVAAAVVALLVVSTGGGSDTQTATPTGAGAGIVTTPGPTVASPADGAPATSPGEAPLSRGRLVVRASAADRTIEDGANSRCQRTATRVAATTAGGSGEVRQAFLQWVGPDGATRSTGMAGGGGQWTAELGPIFGEGQVRWWVTAVDMEGPTARTVDHTITVVNCL